MVTASDSDETAELVYSFDTISGFNKDDKIEGNFSGWFSINQTGGVFTVIELDREKVTRFVIPVVVKDVNATEEQMAIGKFYIQITKRGETLFLYTYSKNWGGFLIKKNTGSEFVEKMLKAGLWP